MINQRVSPGTSRLLGRAGVLVGAALWFSLSSSPASHADEDGLLAEAAHIVEAAPGLAVEPVVEAVEPAAPQAVEPAAPAAEQAVQPVVRVVEPVARQTVESAVKVVTSAPAPVASQVPIIGSSNGSHTVALSNQIAAQHVNAGVKATADKQRQRETADRAYPIDLAPRAMGESRMLRHFGSDDEQGTDEALWTLTNALMHLWAGDQVPGAINAGLAGGVASAGTPWTAPLLLGLLGFLAIVARRRLG